MIHVNLKNLLPMTKEIKLTKTGLDVYETLDVWQVDEERLHAIFATPGIVISIRYYGEDPNMTKFYQNTFCASFEYDYRNPDEVDSFAFVKHSGTYGETLFFKTMNEAIAGCEKRMTENFEGVKDFYSREIVSKAQIPIRELAKKAFYHHYGMFPHLHDFRTKALLGTKYMDEAALYKKRYKNRDFSSEKYQSKLHKIFFKTFGIDLQECIHQWHFDLSTFIKLAGFGNKLNYEKLKNELTDYQFKVVRKAYAHYSY